MKIALIKIEGGRFVPAYDSDYEAAKKIKMGEICEYTYKKPRNYMFHRKFFALINLVYQNQDKFDNFDYLRKYLIMKAGYFKEVITEKGKFYLPESISFEEMDEIKFQELYDKVISVIENEFLIANEAIKENINDFY